MIEIITENLKSEVMILIPASWVIGYVIKHNTPFQNWIIPFVLLIFNIVGAILLLGLGFEAVIQGILATGVIILSHNLVKEGMNARLIFKKENDV